MYYYYFFFLNSGERRLPTPGPVLRTKRTVDAHVQNETSSNKVVLRAANRRHVRQIEMNYDDAHAPNRTNIINTTNRVLVNTNYLYTIYIPNVVILDSERSDK